jgi:hypothetical protein
VLLALAFFMGQKSDGHAFQQIAGRIKGRPDVAHTGIGKPLNLGLVLDQDSELLPVVQAGIRSRGFAGPLWSEQEQRLRHFHTELDR